MLHVQVLKDKERLRRRTQLKRSVYRILGDLDDREEEEPAQGTDQSQSGRDSHLKNYNEDIFDDDDFYHQVGGIVGVALHHMMRHVTCSCCGN